MYFQCLNTDETKLRKYKAALHKSTSSPSFCSGTVERTPESQLPRRSLTRVNMGNVSTRMTNGIWAVSIENTRYFQMQNPVENIG